MSFLSKLIGLVTGFLIYAFFLKKKKVYILFGAGFGVY